MNKFKKYKIDVSSKHKHLIENYLDEMKQHISDNNLDEELYEDIEQRVFEKLAIHKTLNDLLIKQVLQDIGSPEDIFEDEVSSSNTSFVGVIIGGIKKVFLNIKKGTKLIFATGVNIKNIAAFIKVFIIAVLNFIKKSILWGIKNIKTIIIWFIKNIKTLMIFVFGYAKKILFYAIKMLKKIFSLSGSIIGYGILLIALAGMVVLFLLYNGIVIGNVDYFANVPIELIFAYASILGALIILGIYFILKKGFLYHFLVFGICFVSVITFSIIGTTKIYNDH